MEQDPDDSASLDQPSHIRESRRRRTRRIVVPEGKTERAIYVNDIAKRLVPGLDFYLFSLLCGVLLGAAILFDHPAIYILAALIAPFMAPLVGLGFSTAVGSFSFFMQSLGSLLIGSTLVFLSGAISGWISKLIPDFTASQAHYHTAISFPDIVLLLVGTILAIYLTVRAPKQRSLVASVALAYEVYLPIGVAGFGLTGGMHELIAPALHMAGINTLLVITVGTLLLAFMKLHPSTFFGYLLTAALLGGAVYALVVSGAVGSSLEPNATEIAISETTETMQISGNPIPATSTPKPVIEVTFPAPGNATATNTLVPTNTPTVTITPKPPDVYASINVAEGVYARENPCFDDTQCPKIIPAIPDKTPVLVVAFSEDKLWAQIRMDGGQQGWVRITYLIFDAN